MHRSIDLNILSECLKKDLVTVVYNRYINGATLEERPRFMMSEVIENMLKDRKVRS